MSLTASACWLSWPNYKWEETSHFGFEDVNNNNIFKKTTELQKMKGIQELLSDVAFDLEQQILLTWASDNSIILDYFVAREDYYTALARYEMNISKLSKLEIEYKVENTKELSWLDNNSLNILNEISSTKEDIITSEKEIEEIKSELDNCKLLVTGIGNSDISNNDRTTRKDRGWIGIQFYQEELDFVDNNEWIIKNNLSVVSYWRRLEINVEFLNENNIKLSINNWDETIISSTIGYWMYNRTDLKQLIAVANLINFILSQVEVNNQENLWNVKFLVKERFFWKNDLIFNWYSKQNIITQEWLEAVLNWDVRNNFTFNLTVFIESLVSNIFDGTNNVESHSWIQSINVKELMEKLARLFNKEYKVQ